MLKDPGGSSSFAHLLNVPIFLRKSFMDIGGILSKAIVPILLPFGVKLSITEGGIVSGPEFLLLERRARS
jgi:hypothetical protein